MVHAQQYKISTKALTNIYYIWTYLINWYELIINTYYNWNYSIYLYKYWGPQFSCNSVFIAQSMM